MHKIIRHFFPDLFERINEFTDDRERSSYEVSELVTACIAMFLLRETSRNAFNNDRKEARFKENYFKVFRQRLPHMDTVEDLLRLLREEELQGLKTTLVAGLIEGQVFNRFKLLGKHYLVAVDGTGINSYDHDNDSGTRLQKKSKNDVVTYYEQVLEAKLVTPTGLAISLVSEWLANDPTKNYNKQDCEQAGFKRLAEKLKKYFPRLPICLLADGLYPNQPFMEICQNNGWTYIVVLKDDSLKTLQEDIVDIENKHRCLLEHSTIEAKGRVHLTQTFNYINSPLTYKGHTVYWLSCTETITRYDKDKQPLPKQDDPTTFVWLSSQPVTAKNVRNLAEAGRNRWTIENEGFNTQKNGGYCLGHKFARTNTNSYRNYYQCMQLAHLISQLTEHSLAIASLLKADAKLTIKHFWKQAIAWLTQAIAEATDFGPVPRCQIRLR
jgi:hypothetical protein